MELRILTSENGTSISKKLSLVKYNDPVLKQKTPEFDFKHPPINPILLSNQLIEVLKENRGIGLACPQVGYSYRMFVMGVGNNIVAVFNPVILEQSKETVLEKEGCLSFPGLFPTIRRPKQIKVSYQDYTGRLHSPVVYEGLTARLFCHEKDHLDGILFTDVAGPVAMDIAKRKLKKLQTKQ